MSTEDEVTDATDVTEGTVLRHGRAVPDPSNAGRQVAYAKSWAVLIGVNDYRHMRRLDHAVNDAHDTAKLLVDKFGFERDNVHLLLDPPPPGAADLFPGRCRAPTKDAIEEVLLTFLPENVGPDDRVLVFFAGHGEPREMPGTKKRTWYMAPVEGKSGQWHTLVNIQHVFDSLNESKAKHVLYVLDACFSGLALARSAEVAPRRFRGEMLRSRVRQVLSAGSAKQAVADAGLGGHSPFTYHLLHGLGGAADSNRDDTITACELGEYVRKEVEKAFGSAQKPDFGPLPGHESGGDFVFDVPRFWLTAPERVNLAGLLVEDLGLARDEVSPVGFAMRLLDDASKELPAGGPDEAEARRIRRRARFALRRLGPLEAEARDAESQPPGTGLPEARTPEERLFDALIAFRRGQRQTAMETFAALAKECVQTTSGEIAAWALRCLETGGRRHALLIGIGDYERLSTKLQGPPQDAAAMRAVLVESLGFAAEDVECVPEERATAAHVAEKLTELAGRIGPDATFLLYFGGNGVRSASGLVAYVFRDATALESKDGTEWTQENGYLSEVEMDRLLQAISAADKLVITDGCHLAPRPDHQGYRFFAACGRDQTCMEIMTADGTPRGAFTLALERVLRKDPVAPCETMVRDVDAVVHGELRLPLQNSVYSSAGRGGASLVAPDPWKADLLDLAIRPGAARSFAPEQLDDLCNWLPRLQTTTPPAVWCHIARAWALRGHHWRARSSALVNAPVQAASARTHVEVSVGGGDHAAAAAACEVWAAASTGATAGRVQALHARLIVAASRRKRAVLLLHAAEERRGNLLPRLKVRGFSSEDVLVLDAADRSWPEMSSALQTLVDHPGDPALLVIEGRGSMGVTGELLLDIGARTLPAGEIAQRVACHRALTTLLLLQPRRPPDWTSRGVPPRLGDLTIIADATAPRREVRPVYGPPWIDALFRVLGRDGVWRAAEWLEAAGISHAAQLVGDPQARLFEHPDDTTAIERCLREITDAPLVEAESLLEAMSVQRQIGEDARLFLGASLVARDQPTRGLSKIDEAIRLRRERIGDGRADDGERLEPSGVLFWPDAHYQRGHALLALGRLEEAVAAFTDAARQAPRHPHAHYYRAHAIQRLIDEGLERQASAARDEYDALGAPLGRARPRMPSQGREFS